MKLVFGDKESIRKIVDFEGRATEKLRSKVREFLDEEYGVCQKCGCDLSVVAIFEDNGECVLVWTGYCLYNLTSTAMPVVFLTTEAGEPYLGYDDEDI